MFSLSKKADYGLIALKHLALHTDESVSAREIAKEYRIPAELLAKILQRMARKGLVISQQGTRGGYVLGRDPSKISIVDVNGAMHREGSPDGSAGQGGSGSGRYLDLRTGRMRSAEGWKRS